MYVGQRKEGSRRSLERSQLGKPVGAREATSRGMEYIPTSAPRRNGGGRRARVCKGEGVGE